jgi:hypothetical protein
MPNPDASPEPAAQVLAIGMAVRLVQIPSYLKTADPMPMLRPPDLVDTTEQGQVVALRAGGLLAVRFRRGTFLMDAAQLEPVSPES